MNLTTLVLAYSLGIVLVGLDASFLDRQRAHALCCLKSGEFSDAEIEKLLLKCARKTDYEVRRLRA